MEREAEKKSFAAVLLPFLLAGFKRGVDLGAKQGSGKATPDTLLNGPKRREIEQLAGLDAADIVDTTMKDVQAVIVAGREAGKGVQEIGRDIAKMFGEKSSFRSLRIARTELTQSINDGTVRALAEEGYPKKEWRTVIDGNEREAHAAAHGQTVEMLSPFVVDGEMCDAPGDMRLSPGNRINCRCAVAGAGVPEERKRQTDELFLRAHVALERRFVIALLRAFAAQRDRILSQFPS